MQPIIEMLRAYFHNEHLEINDDEELIKCAKDQALSQYLYLVYQKREYKSFYVSAVIKQEAFLNLQKEITDLFNQGEISHFYLKGSVLCRIYPDVSLRTRGDIDVVVSEDDFFNAQELLAANGFIKINAESLHHIEYFKNDLMVELHFKLFDDYNSIDYFKEPFRLTERVDGYLYALTNESFFIHCLQHFSIHLRTGAGLRYILDFYYMLKKFELDKEMLHKLINELGYKRLYNNILNTIYYLTDERLDIFEEENIDFFIDYLISSGIHGFAESKERKVSNYKLGKRIFYKIFMPNRCFRLSLYPKLGRHWFTYPICLFHRIAYVFVVKLKRIILLLFTKNGKATKEEKELFAKIGI